MSGYDFLMVTSGLALVVLAIALLLTVIRLWLGPTLADRILALDTLTMVGLGFIAVFAIRTGFHAYLDIGMGLALVGFLATVAFARYLMQRGNPGDSKQGAENGS